MALSSKLVLIRLDYDEVNTVLDSPAGFQDLSHWNLHKVDGDIVTEDDARTIARDVVKTRLKVIVGAESAPIDIGLFSRRGGGLGLFALRHDFTPYFDGRTAKADTYSRIETALVDTAGTVASMYDDASIVGRGNAALPLGRTLRCRVFSTCWFSGVMASRLAWARERNLVARGWGKRYFFAFPM